MRLIEFDLLFLAEFPLHEEAPQGSRSFQHLGGRIEHFGQAIVCIHSTE